MTELDLTPRPTVDVVGNLPAGQQALYRLEAAIKDSPLPLRTYELVKIRASQLNGCAFCLEMHHHDAVAQGESAERLALLPAWRESELYSHDERIALAMTEAVTHIAQGAPSEALEAEARATFDDETYAALVYAIVAINAWNRLAIVGHKEPGSLRTASAR
jgi:AhpD family alkylhydroperoxidase